MRHHKTFLSFQRVLSSFSKMSEKSLKRGDVLSPPDPNFLRLYSMRFCPFAQRTRIVLQYKAIRHEIINVNLFHKPDWFWARNPLGLVPVIEYKNQVMYESDICDEFLDKEFDADPEKSLFPSCPFEKARHRALMALFDGKVTRSVYRLLQPRREDHAKARADVEQTFRTLEKELSSQPYFGGNRPSMLDFHIYPWFERFEPIKSLSSLLSDNVYDPLPPEAFPLLNKWLTRIQERPEIKSTRLDAEWHMQFMVSLRQKNPQYYIGLDDSTAAKL